MGLMDSTKPLPANSPLLQPQRKRRPLMASIVAVEEEPPAATPAVAVAPSLPPAPERKEEPAALPVQPQAPREKVAEKGFKNGSKLGAEIGLNWVENRSAAPDNRLKIGSNWVENGFENRSKLGAERGAHAVRGNAHVVVQYLMSLSQNTGDRTTPPVSAKLLSQHLDLSYESIRTALKTLIKHKIIRVKLALRGRAGFTQFEIDSTFYEASLASENLVSSAPKRGTDGGLENRSKLGLKIGLTPSCSSSNILNTKTTTTHTELDPLKIELLEHLQNLDAEVLDFARWHIPRNVLGQCIQNASFFRSVAELEDFLHRFQCVLQEKQKTHDPVKSPIGFLKHCLQQQYVGVPAGYVTLDELREQRHLKEQEQELERLQQLKKQRIAVEFRIFQEKLDEQTKQRIWEDAEKMIQKKYNNFTAGEKTLERIRKADFAEKMREHFLAQRPADRHLIEPYLKAVQEQLEQPTSEG